MAFKPGQSGNIKGRPPGARDRINEETRQMIREFVEANWQDLKDSFPEMEAKDKGKLLSALIKHYLPPPINPERLTMDQLEQIAEYLKSQRDEQKK